MAFAIPGARAFDRKTANPETAAAKHDDYAAAGMVGCTSDAQAIAGSNSILSLVTAYQSLAAAVSAARALEAGALWFDMNSVSPDTKRAAAIAIAEGGGRHVDVAVMAPVHPKGMAVPLLVSGPHAEAGAARLREIGFSDVRTVGTETGAASAIKMVRSVMVKGIEALTAECVLAAQAAGVLDEVIESLNASAPGADWTERANYNLDRMMTHGRRRAEEMREASETLQALGVSPLMTDGTVAWQQRVGDSTLPSPPIGLTAKLAALSGLIGTTHHEEAA